MGAKHFSELTAWQLSVQLRDRVAALAAEPRVRRERSLCDDLKRAAESVPNNVAEGFGRFRPRDFRRFLEIARASLCEVQNRLLEAKTKDLVGTEDFDAAWQLSCRAAAAIAKLMRYLQTDRAQQAAARFSRKKDENLEP